MEHFEDFEIPEDVKEKLKDPTIFREHVLQGKTLQEILEFDDQKMELFYNKAHHLYKEHRFKEAVEAFTFLTTLNPFVVNFWIGLGMSEQRLEEFNNALLAFTMGMMTDAANPLPHYQTALCFRAMLQWESALMALEVALQLSEGEEWKHVKEKTTLLKAKILEERS